jgi:DNA-binding CsgD family transcriptional regulator
MPPAYRVSRRPLARRKSRTSRRRGASLTLPPERFLRLMAAKDLESLIDAVFAVVEDVVACSFVSALYRPAHRGVFLKERDSRGREYTPAFTKRHAELTPAARIALANPGLKVLPTRTGLALPEDELRKTDYYREIMDVQGWRHAVALCFWGDPPSREPVSVFGVFRTKAESDFSDDDIARLVDVHGFIDAAVNRIYDREAAKAVQEGLAGAVAEPTGGLAILNWNLTVVQMTPAARNLAHVWSEGGSRKRDRQAARPVPVQIVSACHELQEEWKALVLQSPDATGVRRHRRLRHPTVRGLGATVTLIGPSSVGVFQPSFVVEFHSESHGNAADLAATPLPRQLTLAEGQVARLLLQGLTNQEIADTLGKSVHAVKFLLHRIYVKTALPNRAAFVAALRTRPTHLQAHESE